MLFYSKVFNLISITNETKHINGIRQCKCTLNATFCNNKQRCNNENCRCECKELTDKESCDKEFIWNFSNCGFECNISCDLGEYLDYTNCKCRKRLIDTLVEKCIENINGRELIYNSTLNEYEQIFSFCKLRIVLFVIGFLIIIDIGSTYFYVHWYLKKDITRVKFNTKTQTTTY